MAKSILFDKTKNGGIRGNVCYDGITRAFGADCASVLAKIARYCEMKAGVCNATEDRLAWEVGISARTLEKHVQTLEKEGMVKDHTPKLRNKPHTYTINAEKIIAFEKKFRETVGDYEEIEDQVVRKTFVEEIDGTKKFRTEYAKISYRDGVWYAKFSDEEKVLRKEKRIDAPAKQAQSVPSELSASPSDEKQEDEIVPASLDDNSKLLEFLKKKYGMNNIPDVVVKALETVFEGKHKKSTKPMTPAHVLAVWDWHKTEQVFKDAKYLHNTKNITDPVKRFLYDLSIVVDKYEAYLQYREHVESEHRRIAAEFEERRKGIDITKIMNENNKVKLEPDTRPDTNDYESFMKYIAESNERIKKREEEARLKRLEEGVEEWEL